MVRKPGGWDTGRRSLLKGFGLTAFGLSAAPLPVSGQTSSDTVVLGDFESGLDGWETNSGNRLSRVSVEDRPAAVTSGQSALEVTVYLYVGNDYQDESEFEEGDPVDGWDKNQELNKRFRDMVFEESDNRSPFSPRREKHYEWGFDSLPAYGPHPVMVGGHDGDVLTSDQLKKHEDFGNPHFPWE